MLSRPQRVVAACTGTSCTVVCRRCMHCAGHVLHACTSVWGAGAPVPQHQGTRVKPSQGVTDGCNLYTGAAGCCRECRPACTQAGTAGGTEGGGCGSEESRAAGRSSRPLAQRGPTAGSISAVTCQGEHRTRMHLLRSLCASPKGPWAQPAGLHHVLRAARAQAALTMGADTLQQTASTVAQQLRHNCVSFNQPWHPP